MYLSTKRVRLLADELWDAGECEIASDLHTLARKYELRTIRTELVPLDADALDVWRSDIPLAS